MYFLLALLSIICALALFFLARLAADLRSICRQLEEIGRGSHIELTVTTRQKSLLTLCRSLNRILADRDQGHILYERAEKQLKQNITNLAHDIRTPLTGASGYLQLALECQDAGKRNHYLTTAGRRLAELEDMLEKLFLYTKLANDTFSFPPENRKHIQVLPLLSDCLLSLYTRFEEKGMEPELLFETEGFRVWADEDALRRIFLNLLQNALIHGAGNLKITQQPTRGHRRPGIDSGYREAPFPECCLIFENLIPQGETVDPEQIFQLFYKADSARGKASSGLGLYIVKELMKRMDGDAEAELENSALRIILYFPLSEPLTS